MEQPINNIHPYHNGQQQQPSQQEAKDLFDNVSMSQENPFENLELSSQLKPHSERQQQSNDENSEKQDDFRSMMRKAKKQKKKEKKYRKKKQAILKNQGKKENLNYNIQSSAKKQGKKMMLDSEQEEIQGNNQQQQVKKDKKPSKITTKKSSKKPKTLSDQDQQRQKKQLEEDSDQYSSEQLLSQQQGNQLQNLNPDVNKQVNEDPNQEGNKKFKKRLGKNSRMAKIMAKEGFDLKQLGNDGDVDYELNESINESDESYSSSNKKKKDKNKNKKQGNKKLKKQSLTNEQLMDKLKQMGCQQQVDENESQRYNYDNGIELISKLRPTKESSKNAIKIQNKMFGDIEMELQRQNNQNDNQQGEQQEVPSQKLELQFKPKSSMNSSKAGSFLSKVQVMKKHRGLEADIDQQQFQKIAKQKAKRSISQLVSKINHEINEKEQIDIQIAAPSIAKGKSGDLINNTMFIVKSLNQKNSNPTQNAQIINGGEQNKNKNDNMHNNGNEILQKTAVLTTSISVTSKSKKSVSRIQFFKQIKESISVKRSKYFSAEQLKNSFKASKLEELQQIRKKIQEKRRKQAMYQLGQVQDDDAENVINELQQQLARKDGISRADFRKLLRMEEGLQQLENYEEVQQKKKKKKNPEDSKNEDQNKVEIPKKSDQKREETPAQQNTKDVKLPTETIKTDHLKAKSIQNKEQIKEIKAIDEQKILMHADDMIEQYDGQQEEINEQMDVEDEKINDEEEDNEESSESQPQVDQDQENDEQEVSNIIQQEVAEDKTQKQEQINDVLRKQLQDEGIILPGAAHKKKAIEESFSIDKYVASSVIQNINDNKVSQQPNQQISNSSSKKSATNSMENNENSILQNTLQFKQFKKLRKIAVVIQQKKKKREEQLKRAKEYFEQQAQLGSDNEDNDDHVKQINKKQDDDEYDGDDLDQQLQELIDNAVDINEANQQEAFKRYMQDVKQKDREQLQKILRGDFRRVNHDQLADMGQMEQDERNRVERMQKMVEWMRKREDDDNGMYIADEDDEDDEMNYYYDYNGTRKRITHKKNKNNDLMEGEETPQQNEQEIQRKLQFYLMDTISPAKVQIEAQVNTQIVMQLPQTVKRNKTSNIGSFDKKNDFKISVYQNENKQKQKQYSNPFSFAGTLMNLVGNKGGNQNSVIPKMKKTTSHMSEYLNKTKSQKPMSAQGSSTKLPGIFGRVMNSKK